MAKTVNGQELSYKVVYKTQKKWERHSDPDSWRREYDLYAANLDTLFSDSFCWAKCYHTELTGDETQIWMEYIEGVSGLALTSEMYKRTAEELGRFQGRLYAEQPEVLKNLSNLSKIEFAKNYYLRYRS